MRAVENVELTQPSHMHTRSEVHTKIVQASVTFSPSSSFQLR
jgi:hypothetical protein